MKILTVSCIDDNFGDNLIRITFEKLLRTVLKNLSIDSSDYSIRKMCLKKIEPDLIHDSDLIIFAGGGLFGLNYMNYFHYMDEITKLADQWNIPVILSSIGANNMDATPDNEYLLSDMLHRRCFYAVSVRENPALFERYAAGCPFEIRLVCDPAVWSKFIYHSHLTKLPEKSGSPLIGVNVVRGGLFSDNDNAWKLADEMNYCSQLKDKLEAAGMRCVFYTNGSFLDNNALHYYASEYNLPPEQVVYPRTTRELIETISRFDAVAAIRMHSSIISYALEIPSVNLVWNDKIPYFYNNIGYPERTFSFAEWNAEAVFNAICTIKSDDNYRVDPDYLMTLYQFLFETMAGLFPSKADAGHMYDFERVKTELQNNPVSFAEDTEDMQLKIEKSEKHYLSRFIEMKKKDKEFKQLKKTADSQGKEIEKLKKELARLNSLLVVKGYKRLRAIKRKLIKRLFGQ